MDAMLDIRMVCLDMFDIVTAANKTKKDRIIIYVAN